MGFLLRAAAGFLAGWCLFASALAAAQEIPLTTRPCMRSFDPGWYPPMPSPCDFHLLPEQPSSRVFVEWLNIFAVGREEAIARFVEDNTVPGALTAQEQVNLRRRTGGYEFVRLESITEHSIEVLLQAYAWKYFVRATLTFEAEAPHRLASLAFQRVPRPVGLFTRYRATPENMVWEFVSKLRGEAEVERFSGAAMIARNGEVIASAAHGLADREQNIPNTLETKFRIGSMNKMFTAVAVMQLVEDGLIDLDATLAAYLPDYPNREYAAAVTIHQLLTHTGGAGDIFGPAFIAHRLELRTLEDYVALYGAREADVPETPVFSYANYGYILLGRVIEEVSGQSYYDYVRENIFLPAEMFSTDSLPEELMVPGRSRGYTRFLGDALSDNADTLPYRGTSAGGGYSTVGDLVRFADALLSHRLLNAENTEKIMRGKVAGVVEGVTYAYGLLDGTDEGIRFVGHGGGAPGMSGELLMFPETGEVIAILANLDPPVATDAAFYFARSLPLAAAGP